MRWLVFTLIALVAATVVAFTIQNNGRTVELSLDIGFAAWKLARPATASAVVWGSFGAGVLLAATVGFVRRRALVRKVRQLEQQLAMSGRSSSSTGASDWRG